MQESLELEMTKGDDEPLYFEFSDEDGTPIDITGYTVFLTIKTSIDDTDAEAIVSKTQTSHTDPTNGKTTITIEHLDTSEEAAGTYYYDIQLKDTVGNINTPDGYPAYFILKPEVTIRIS